MSLYRKIAAFFKPVEAKVALTEGDAARWQRLQEDPGEFVYEEDGFCYPFEECNEQLKWSAIERIAAYKVDLMTTDEISLDILSGGRKITNSESTPGWYQFLTKLQQVFPSIPADWDRHITQPPFARNYTVLYERENFVLPESNNFSAWFRNVDPLTIVRLFEEQGWEIRKAGWTEWEMTNTWSELHLEPDNEGVLLNGLVAFHPNKVEILNQLMDRVGSAYQYEFHDDRKNLLIERRHL